MKDNIMQCLTLAVKYNKPSTWEQKMAACVKMPLQQLFIIH